MTKVTKPTTSFAVPAPGPYGYPDSQTLYLVRKGADTYEGLRLGQAIEVAVEGGAKRPAVIQSLQVSPLIDLLPSLGGQTFHTYGRGGSALALIQALTDESTEAVLDVTKVYTSIGVLLLPQVDTAAEPAA